MESVNNGVRGRWNDGVKKGVQTELGRHGKKIDTGVIPNLNEEPSRLAGEPSKSKRDVKESEERLGEDVEGLEEETEMAKETEPEVFGCCGGPVGIRWKERIGRIALRGRVTC